MASPAAMAGAVRSLAPAAAAAAGGGGGAIAQGQLGGGCGGETGAAAVAATLEDARERGELQRSYYGLLHAITQQLPGALLEVPPGILDSVLTDVARGGVMHVDPAVRRTCVQILARLYEEWCGADGKEALPGFRSFALQQMAGEACVLGLLGRAQQQQQLSRAVAGDDGSAAAAAVQQPLDARDAATVALLGEVAAALKLVQERNGAELGAHLCTTVLPASGLPGELQQQLLAQVTAAESDAKQLKEFLRQLLLSLAASSSGKR
jgi:exportin-T